MSKKNQTLEEGRIRLKYKINSLEIELKQAKAEYKQIEKLQKKSNKSTRMYRGQRIGD